MSEGATGQGAKTLCSLNKSCARSLQTPPPTLETWQHLTMAPRYRSKEHAAAPSILSLTQDELVNILGRLSLAERCAKRVAGFLRPRRPQHRRQRRCSLDDLAGGLWRLRPSRNACMVRAFAQPGGHRRKGAGSLRARGCHKLGFGRC